MVARLECSLQPDGGEGTATGMRQEVDIRYVVTSLGWAFIDMATGHMGVPRARICTLPKDFRTYSGTI